jgi:hypothetical protein
VVPAGRLREASKATLSATKKLGFRAIAWVIPLITYHHNKKLNQKIKISTNIQDEN